MKRYFAIILACLLFLTAGKSYADGRSEALLGNVRTAVKSIEPYRGEYTVDIEGNRSSGFFIVSGDNYHLNAGSLEVIGSSGVKYEINHQLQEVAIDNIDPQDRNILANPARAFDFAGEVFSHRYAGEEKAAGKECDVVVLVPREANGSFSEITLLLDKKTYLPVMLRYKVEGVSGDITISITKLSRDNFVNNELFRFDAAKYAGFEVIDFR